MTSAIVLPFTPTVNSSGLCIDVEPVVATVKVSFLEQMLGVVRNLVPTNIIGDAARLNLLPLVTTSIVLGLLLPPGGTVLSAAAELNDAVGKVVSFLIKLAPFGIASIVFGAVAENGPGIVDVAPYLGVFLGAVTFGLLFHMLVALPLVFFALSRRNPAVPRADVARAATALGCASSAGTLPVTMRCASSNGVSPTVSRLVLPLGATINMDGTAPSPSRSSPSCRGRGARRRSTRATSSSCASCPPSARWAPRPSRRRAPCCWS